MNATRTHLSGELSFTAYYTIGGKVEDRPVKYSSVLARYQPDSLRVELTCGTLRDSELPRYANLKVSSLTVSGGRIKKDGTPGNVTASEKFYSFELDQAPDWAQALADEALTELKGEGR
ncbi:MAG TPA: hypothetical protein VGG75_37965 [Trebonia sp.]